MSVLSDFHVYKQRASNLVAELEVSLGSMFPHSDQKDPSHRGHPLVDATDAIGQGDRTGSLRPVTSGLCAQRENLPLP